VKGLTRWLFDPATLKRKERCAADIAPILTLQKKMTDDARVPLSRVEPLAAEFVRIAFDGVDSAAAVTAAGAWRVGWIRGRFQGLRAGFVAGTACMGTLVFLGVLFSVWWQSR